MHAFVSLYLKAFFQNGSYELVSISKNFGDYLAAMGVPSFVLPMALRMKETITYAITGNTIMTVFT